MSSLEDLGSVKAPPSATDRSGVTGFAAALHQAVEDCLSNDDLLRARRQLHRKALIISLWFVAAYVGIVLATGWIQGLAACTSFAFAAAAIGFNIQHDANHNAFFDTHGVKRLTRANRLVGWSLFAIGADANRWIYRHGTLHHGSPNVVGTDAELDLGALARFAPGQSWYWWHRYQHLYIWPLYLFAAFEIISSDLTSLVRSSRQANGRARKPTFSDFASALGSKLLAGFLLIGVPALVHPIWTVVLGGVAVLMMVGFLLAMVLQVAHIVEEAAFAEDKASVPCRWHEWQIRTSIDFSHSRGFVARIIRWLCGGLDHQAEHHLYPRLPHTAYPLITDAVSEVCRQFGIERYTHPNYRSALASHYRLLRRLGKGPNTSGHAIE